MGLVWFLSSSRADQPPSDPRVSPTRFNPSATHPQSHPGGVFLAVLGPDGCGKSSVIDALVQELGNTFRGTRRFHFRPSLGRGDGPVVTDPYAAPPRSPAGSVAKLAYYWADYVFGYLMRIRAGRQSELVVFDRYVHDIAADPIRYRYGGPMWAVHALERLVPGPDLCLVLDAPAEVLQARKQEVTLEQSRQQRDAYRRLAERVPEAHLLDASRPLDEVVEHARCLVLRQAASGPRPALRRTRAVRASAERA